MGLVSKYLKTPINCIFRTYLAYMDGEARAEEGPVFSSIGALEVQMSVDLFVSPHFAFQTPHM